MGNVDKYREVPTVYELLRYNNVIFLNGDIDEKLATEMIAQLLYYDSTAGDDEEITMYINSYGGIVTAGLAIIDVMQACHHTIHTICAGVCASMAGMILASGDKRSTLSHSLIMFHEVSGMVHDKLTDVKVTVKVMAILQKYLANILKKKTALFSSKKKINLDHDVWLTATQALELKIVDDIIKG